MNFNEQQAAIVLGEIRKILDGDAAGSAKMRLVWEQIISAHAQVLAMALPHFTGDGVYAGPFKGMKLTGAARGGAAAPVILGCYERELHPAVERACASPFKHVLNIGCAFGYYTVGFARRMLQAEIHAFDIDEASRAKCREMAALNGVQDRVTIGGEFRGEDFAAYADEPTLVFMDIEGGEKALLDPERYPALRRTAVIVELHDVYDASISSTIRARFAATHEMEIVANSYRLPDLDWKRVIPVDYVDPFDQFMCGWENRGGATPWGVFWPQAL